MSILRFGTYNVLIPRTDTLGKGVDSWLERRNAVVDTIERSFDFVGLQECSFGHPYQQGEFIADSLHGLGWESYLPNEKKLFSDEFHERLPIFWRKGAFTPERFGQVLLSSWTERELALVPILENRYASFVSGRLRDGRKFTFLTLHLQHQRAESSAIEQSLAQIKREEGHRRALMSIYNFAEGPGEVMIAGDFNSVAHPSHFSEHRLYSIEVAGESAERWEHDSFHDWRAPLHGGHLDKVFVSKGLFGGIARIGDSLASDHYPVSYSLPLD